MNLKTWCLQIWGVNTFELPAVQKHYYRQKSKHSIFSPTLWQCSIPSKLCPLRKRLPLSSHKNSSQIFDATKLWKHTIPLTYNTKTLISNISETHRFSPQMRLIAYPDHKTTLLTGLISNSRTARSTEILMPLWRFFWILLYICVNSALVWGSSVKHNPQKVGKEHTLNDEDVIQIVKKV